MKSRGLTLVEVLTVIGVTTVLSAILLPVIGSVKQRARTQIKLQQLKQLATGTLIYLGESDSILPPVEGTNRIEWHHLALGGASRSQAAQFLNPDMPSDASVFPGRQFLGYALNQCLRGSKGRPFHALGEYNPFLIIQADEFKHPNAVRTYTISYELPCHDKTIGKMDNLLPANGRFLADADHGGSVAARMDGGVKWHSYAFFKDKECSCRFTGSEPENPFQSGPR